MKVIITKKKKGWMLSITSDQHDVHKYWIYPRLIDAIFMAHALKVHVDNIDELPLNQY